MNLHAWTYTLGLRHLNWTYTLEFTSLNLQTWVYTFYFTHLNLHTWIYMIVLAHMNLHPWIWEASHAELREVDMNVLRLNSFPPRKGQLWTTQNVPRRSRTSQFSGSFSIFLNSSPPGKGQPRITQYKAGQSRMFQIFSGCSRMFQDVPGLSRMFQDIPRRPKTPYDDLGHISTNQNNSEPPRRTHESPQTKV